MCKTGNGMGMRMRASSRWGLALVALALAASGCAYGIDGDDEEAEDGIVGAGDEPVLAGHPPEHLFPVDNACGVDCSQIQTDECFEAVCNEETGKCAVVAQDGVACDDGQFCTVGEMCAAGVCEGGTPNDCGMQADPCHLVSCNEATESCSQSPGDNGSYCTPDSLCEVNGQCQGGHCYGTPKDCTYAPVPNECHVAQCNPQNGVCEAQVGNDGMPCTDLGELCTVDKICSAGSCIGGVPMDCSALTQGCYDGLCDPGSGSCYQQVIPEGASCQAATDDCNEGLCSAQGECLPQPINEGLGCDDGLGCTSGTICTAGQCDGGSSSVTIYFREDFTDNSAGWTLGSEWEIGAATESPGSCSFGYEDPSQDHSVGSNDGIAGVVIGGYAATTIHDYYYLTSPVVDTSAATSLYLEFSRWLNSDYTPYMQNQIQVFDGLSWVTIWESTSPGIQDGSWLPMVYDLSAYANAALQVRFGFKVGSSGVYTVSQWNLDDVLFSSGVCTP